MEVAMKFKDTTRDGTPVRIYATDGTTPRSIHGAVKTSLGWRDERWYIDGRYKSGDPDHRLDLIPEERVVWINEDDDGFLWSPYESENEAKKSRNPDFIRVHRVVLKY